MKEQTLPELIDQYLLGTISPRDRSHLEQLIAGDPDVAALVAESQLAYKALKHEQHRRLKEKLRDMDKEDFRHQGFFLTKTSMLSFFFFFLVTGYFLASVYYSPIAVARRNFETIGLPQQRLAGDQGQADSWLLAEESFKKKDYESSIQQYMSLSTQAERMAAAQANWNILMAQLAMEGPTNNWKLAMATFSQEATEPFRSKAHHLSSLFDSRLYGLFHLKLRENLSGIKPRLI